MKKPKEYKDDDLMPYGRHKGKKLSSISRSYWMHMYRSQFLDEDLSRYVKRKFIKIK